MTDYDVVVVGSGFGGAVAALRLTEKGYRVAVLEAGRRFADHEFARTSWDVRRFLWAPRLGCYGIQRIHRLPHVTVLAGAGVGGGSHALPARRRLLRRPAVGRHHRLADGAAPYFVLASRMLGVG